ncbi:hypothetical protein GVN20_07175 [Runella sp. CRIBMP]|uniref:OmpP1/FadL family transporter n=1 Tax=Runella sp. CRIBMP TaxID=2683261 RepID=UPI0014134268|nr:hypothetical protein [Runella sp. CRIBMP]NBB19131.1 hypothetical protein [Runella sp. CRIBMP]
MSMYKTRKLLQWSWVLGVLFLQTNVHAQGLGNAPYSAIGIGELLSRGYSPSNAMGDVGVSASNPLYINSLNPALLVRNRYTMFDVGVIGQYKSLQDSQQNQRDFGGNIGYLALSFPVAPKWSLGLSLKPYSFVNYQQNSYGRIGTSIYEAQYVYSGKGGLNQINLTNGFQIGKNLSVGADFTYLFGNFNRSVTSQLRIGDSRDYIVSRDDRLNMSDVNLKLGAAYRQKLKEDHYLNFGATYNLASSVNTIRNTTLEVLSSAGQPITNPDTITQANLNVNLPANWRVGLSYEKFFKLLLSFDYDRQNWSQYKGISGNNENMRDGQSFHFGMEYVPKFNSTKYWDLVFYRLGFIYHQTPLVIGTKPVDDMSISMGMSLPVGRNFVNLINISFVAGQRGTVSSQTFRERYGRVVLGISLKDTWFQKFKVD